MLRIIIGIAVGALVGFLYYKLIGCSSGVCPITSSPFNCTVLGALMGGMLGAG